MTRKNNKKFLKAFQTRKAFSHKLSDVLVRESVVGDPLRAVCLRKVVRESLPKEVSRSTLTRRVSSILTDTYFDRRMDFALVGRVWYVKLKSCIPNVRWIRCLNARIGGTLWETQELPPNDIRRIISAMNYAYSEIAVEKKKKDVRFDPRYNVISFIKVVSLAELKLKIKLNFYNRGRIMAIFKKNCAKRYVFNGNCMCLPMSESKRARAIMRAGNRGNAEKNEEIDVNLYERVKKEFVVSVKYSYANRHLFDPLYDSLLVGDVLDKVLNRNGIKLNQRQKQRWVKRIVGDKYLSLFFVFSKKCIPNGKGNYKSSRYILRFKSNQRRLRSDVFILQKRFAKAQREREEREVKSSSQTKRHISLRSKDSLYSLYSSSPGSKVGTTAKTLVRPPGDPPDGGENPFEFGVSGGGFWPPHGPDLPRRDDCDRDISCAVSAHSRLLDFDVSALAGTGWRFREKRKP